MKPSSSSGKGPPPNKRSKPLSAAAEKMRKYRAAQSADQKRKEYVKNQEWKANMKASQSADKRNEEKAKTKERISTHRASQSADQRDEEKAKNKEKISIKRANQSANKKKEEYGKNSDRISRQCQKARTKVSSKGGLRSKEIMDGRYRVVDLKDSDDKIGEMDVICQYCSAQKFKKETGSTCCGNGKVMLDSFPTPPPSLNMLWRSNDAKGRVFRENARAINNAVCLTSLKVKHHDFGQGYIPNVIFEGKVQQFAGPLQAAEGEKPCFAQLYVHDPSLETGQRFNNMTIPASMSSSQKKILEGVLKSVQTVLHKVNPFVRDFKQIMDIPAEELKQGKIVISAKAKPSEEHERRYNAQINLQEVSILTNSEPHDLVLQKRGGELQSISDLNPKGMPLHFTLLFPHGTYGWDLMMKHTDGKRRVTPGSFMFFISTKEISTKTSFIWLDGFSRSGFAWPGLW